MVVNVKQFIAAGIDRAQWAALDGDGYGVGTALTLANGSTSNMGRLLGAQNFGPSFPEPEYLDVPGDDVIQQGFQFPGNALPTFSVAVAPFDLDFRALSEGTTLVAEGDLTMLISQPSAPVYPDMSVLLTQKAKHAVTGASGFAHMLVMRGTAAAIDTDSMQTGANHSPDRYSIRGNRTNATPWGANVATAGFGVSDGVTIRFWSENRVSMSFMRGDGAEDEIALQYLPAAATGNKVQVWVAGTKQTYTTDYTVDTGTGVLTFESGSIPAAGEQVFVLYEHLGLAS